MNNLQKIIPFQKNKVINLTRRQHKFLSLERATIAEWQSASEGQKFVAKPTQLHMTLFFWNDIRFPFFFKYLLFFVFAMHANSEIPKYYQDLLIANETVIEGENLCSNRYELIKPIFQQFFDRFTVLDLGAAQGYFSFKIAHDFPNSTCIMIETNQISEYKNSAHVLHGLCLLNPELKNVYLLDKKITLDDLKTLNNNEHFDVVLAFLIVHTMDSFQKEKIKIIETLLSLGTNVIVEIAPDQDILHSTYIEYLSTKVDCEYLGEVKRNNDPHSTAIGKMYWFRTNHEKTWQDEPFIPIKEETFKTFNGIYPPNLAGSIQN